MVQDKRKLSRVTNTLSKVLTNLGLDKRLHEHTFLTLWPTFVSGAIGSRSRALFIDSARNLVVTVADASTGQELSMVKGQILNKVQAAARSLSIEITGIRLDLKHYHGVSTSVLIGEDGVQSRLPQPDPRVLAGIALSGADVEQLQRLKVQMDDDGVPDEMQSKIIASFEAEMRLRRWRFANNYPVCEACGNPVERLHARAASRVPKPDDTNRIPHKLNARPTLCISCLYASQTLAASNI